MKLFGGHKPQIKGDSSVGITDRGEKQVMIKSVGKDYAILAKLKEDSPQTVSQIAQSTAIEVHEVKSRIEHMARLGYVSVIPSEM